MDWLSRNWVWVALAIGVWFYFFRSRPGGHSGGHGGVPEDMGHGGHPGGDAGHSDQTGSHVTTNAPDAAIDPVSGEAVRTDQALTSIFQGNVYYFSSSESRDRFEAAPQEYARKAVGHPVRPAEAYEDRRLRRNAAGRYVAGQRGSSCRKPWDAGCRR